MSSAKKKPQQKPNIHSLLPVLSSKQTLNTATAPGDKIKHLVEYKSLSSPSAITEEAERKRLSRELHDGLGQLLTTIGLQVNQCINGFEGNQDSGQPISKHKASLEQLSLLVQEAIGEVRSLCCAIRPAILDDLGILAAISWQCRQISRAAPELVMVTSFNIEEEQIPVAYRSAIYRIVQESLNNAVKYAQASRIRISLRLEDESIHLSIVDNGIGFDLSKIQQKLGIGLMSMRERAASIQGKLEIDTSSGTGVEIRAQFPIEAMAG